MRASSNSRRAGASATRARQSLMAPGAITLVRYAYPVGSTALIERIRDEQSVLVVPGDHFGMDGYLRIGFGCDPELLVAALDRVGDVLDALPAETLRPANAR